jgi:ribonuclease HII
MLKPFYKDGVVEAGCDEAGRGCLSGPVFAAAVILPEGFFHPLLNDSKKMTEKNRDILRPIIEREAIAYAVATCSAEEIDNINILNASFLAMHRAIDQLKVRPEFLLIDGNRFNPYPEIQHKCIIGGDAQYQAISAASVLAKTYRDEYMQALHNEYPEYNWKKNKGYPTTDHRLAIRKHGLTQHHRRTFAAKFVEPSLFD